MKRRLTFLMIAVFVPLLAALSYAMSERSFMLSIQREVERAQWTESVIVAEIQSASKGLSYEGLLRMAAQYQKAYATRGIELLFFYNEHPMNGATLPSRYYDELLSNGRSAMLDTRSSPELYVIGDPLTESFTLLTIQDVSGIYALRRELRQMFFLWGLAGALGIALLSWFIASWFIRPVKQLTKAAELLSQQTDETYSLSSHRKDELGTLATSFEKMHQSVHERESALRHAAEKQQSLLEALAHEMRTPLCALLGNTRLLENPQLPEAQRGIILARMANEIKRLSDMDTQLLKLVELGSEEIERKTVWLLALFKETAHRLASQSNGVQISIEGPDITLLGDRILLSLMIDNLVVNALRASSSGQMIHLVAKDDGFSVRDEGCGMTEGQLAHAFEAFYKADKARTRIAGGVGLGLSLSQRIAELHGGTLSLASCLGKGTTATFTTLLQPVEDSVTSSVVSSVQEVENQ